MPLHEVDQKILKKEKNDIVYRFLQDLGNKINLFIWQKAEQVENTENFGIEKFQFSHRSHILEWREGAPLKYGQVDDGSNPMGMKRSPMMMLQSTINRKAFELIVGYLEQQELAPDLRHILKTLKEFEHALD